MLLETWNWPCWIEKSHGQMNDSVNQIRKENVPHKCCVFVFMTISLALFVSCQINWARRAKWCKSQSKVVVAHKYLEFYLRNESECRTFPWKQITRSLSILNLPEWLLYKVITLLFGFYVTRECDFECRPCCESNLQSCCL